MDNSSLFLAYCHFHDSVIADVDYNDGKLILDIPKSYYEDTYDNLKVEIEINDYDFVFYYFKRFPQFKKPVWKGKVLSLNSFKKIFKKGFELEIEEFLISPDSLKVVFECSVYPSPRRKAAEKKIRIDINNFKGFVLKNNF